MIHAIFEISEIDYETTLKNLLHLRAVRNAAEKEKNSGIFSFWMENEDIYDRFIDGGFGSLTNAEKNMCVCSILQIMKPKLRETLHKVLQKNEIGRNVSFIDFRAENDGDTIQLVVAGVQADYGKIMECGFVKQKIDEIVGQATGKIPGKAVKNLLSKGINFAAKAVVTTSPQTVENKVKDYLSKEQNRKKVLSVANKTLAEYGVCMKLKTMEIQVEKG